MIALYKPQIPPNTGNIARLCVGLEIPLLIVGKPAFSLSSQAVRRAGLDHWADLEFYQYKKMKDFYLNHRSQRIVPISKFGKCNLWNFPFTVNDVLLFGNETYGLPPTLRRRLEPTVFIPMSGKIRSLNLSNAAAVVAYEKARQLSYQA